MASPKGIMVTLLIPGLFAFTPQNWQEVVPLLPKLPGLSALLRLCRRTAKKPANFESLLSEKFTDSVQKSLPVAMLTYLHDLGQIPQNYVMRADPVYLKADSDCLYLLGYENLKVTRQEAEKLAEEINRVYVEDGWSLQIGSPGRWYLCLEKKPLIETLPLSDVFGKNIAGYLPRGREEKKWRTILTELQMVLHSSEVNLQRTMTGQLPINSLWVWGEGNLKDLNLNPANTIDYVWSEQALCLGLAKWANCHSSNIPYTASEWIEQAESGRHLIVFDDMSFLAKERFHSWTEKLTQLDEHWFTPLKEAIDKKLLTQIRVEFETGMIFETVTRLDWNKLWRKKRLWYEWNSCV